MYSSFYLFSSLNDLRDFLRVQSLFVLYMIPPFKKVTKKKAVNNLFQFSFTLLKCYIFVICRYFTILKWLKVLKLSKICLKIQTPWHQKQPIRTFGFSFNLHCRLNGCSIKLQILINNYLWINLASTWIWDPGMPNARCLWTIPVRKLDEYSYTLI